MKAFPALRTEQYQDVDGNWREKADDGMNLRDYFAAKAMPIVVSIWNDVIKNNQDQDWDSPTLETSDYDLIANDCYEMADAMMKAREQ
jgi:hypothetical protein